MNLTDPPTHEKLVRQREEASEEREARWWRFAAPVVPGRVITIPCECVCERERVCVCVCVCVRERERVCVWENE